MSSGRAKARPDFLSSLLEVNNMHEIIKLENGVRIICEQMPYVRSAAIGIFINFGSRNESPAENGSAHFIEHMLFKRTEKHSAAQLAFDMDAIGGQVNAFTTREATCFYARVLDTHLNTAIDLLSEMFFECAFDEAELESERGVILEEIGMYEDTPDDVCYEKLMAGCYKGALGRPVLGKPSTLANMTGAGLKAYKEAHYTAGNIIVSLCGNYQESHLARIRDTFSAMPKSKTTKPRRADYSRVAVSKRKRTEQNQFCIAFPSCSSGSEERFAMNLLSTALGGGVSSRLFQNVREKHGLCYSIYSFQSGFQDTGILAVATAVGKDTEAKALGLIGDELKALADKGIMQDELDRAREQVKSSLVMSLESTNARMLKMGNSMLIMGSCLTPDELLERYDAVTREDILSLAQKRFDFSQLSLSAIGKVGPAEEYIKALGL